MSNGKAFSNPGEEPRFQFQTCNLIGRPKMVGKIPAIFCRASGVSARGKSARMFVRGPIISVTRREQECGELRVKSRRRICFENKLHVRANVKLTGEIKSIVWRRGHWPSSPRGHLELTVRNLGRVQIYQGGRGWGSLPLSSTARLCRLPLSSPNRLVLSSSDG